MVRSQQNPQKYNWIFFLISVFIVLIATLYPFNFSKIVKFSITEIIASFNNSSSFQDQVNNILLFLPVGWTFGNLCQNSIKKITLQIFFVILVSFGLSLTVEFLQIFLPSRSPTPADLLNNSLGGLFGFIGFSIWNAKSFSSTVEKLESSRVSKSSKLIICFFCGYLVLTLFISLFWQGTTNLSNWDSNYYLSVGNEITGNKAWAGYVSEISIVDRAISRNEASQTLADANYLHKLGNSLVAHYKLNGECCYQDQTGNQPELLWQGRSASTSKSQGAFLDAHHWLKTSTPVSHLSQRMSQTSEFTISTAIATTNVNQKGPARIISVSGSSQRRNWTLGQQGNSLDFRLRTPLTGENGTELKLNIPNIFTDTYLHHLVITYSRGNIQIYVDKLENFHSFSLLDLIPKEQRIFYYALTFMPLGIGLGIITFLARKKLIFYRILFYSGILIPSLMLEGILVSESGKDFSIKHLLLGISFTAVTMIFLRIRAARLKTIS
ncbi:VanZ family protein [Anabaena sp. CCY 9910]|uniref:VanZ family protein n=1 Tax=Anabaena sp. CCY 9910 TaxID=3103870 RepID=UPI0039E0D172